MSDYEVFSDRRHNRLHLVLTPALTEKEADSIAFCAKAAAKKLRPGFEINVRHAVSDLEPFFGVRQRQNSRHVLKKIIEAVCA
jgi:hypothetical protein